MPYSETIVEAIKSGEFGEGELEKIEEAIEAKRGYTEPKGPTKAYGKPYGEDFIKAVLKLLKKAGIKLSDEDQDKLEAMAGKTGEVMISKHGTFYSVLPQEERGLTKLKVNMATGELYRPTTEEENEQIVKEFMTAGMEHQQK